MKKLKTNNTGRMPLWQADLDWIQNAFTEPIMALVNELKLPSRYFMPITGCKVTKTEEIISMTSGWFWWAGEMLPVRALEPTKISSFTAPAVHLEKVIYYDQDGARNFIKADLTTESVSDVWQDDYILPKVVERFGSFTTGVHILPGARTLFDDIKLCTTDSESEWNTIYGVDPLDVSFKRIGRMVILRGAVFSQVESTPVTLGLPRPLGGWATLHHNTSDSDLKLCVTGEGGLSVEAHTGGAPLLVSLTGMMYMAEDPYITIPVDTNVIVCEQ